MGGAVLALVLLIAAIAAGPLLGRVRGFGWGRVVIDLVAIGVLGGVGLALGLFVFAGVVVTGATGVASGFGIWGAWIFAAACVALGAMGGLALVERLWRHTPGRGRALAGALAGLGAGSLIGFVAIILGQNTGLEIAVLCLIPPAAVSTTFAGFALARPLQRGGAHSVSDEE